MSSKSMRCYFPHLHHPIYPEDSDRLTQAAICLNSQILLSFEFHLADLLRFDDSTRFLVIVLEVSDREGRAGSDGLFNHADALVYGAYLFRLGVLERCDEAHYPPIHDDMLLAERLTESYPA